MPILHRLTGDPDPDSPNGHRDEPQPKGISPIMPGRPGRPSFSLEALRERVEQQFHEETANRTDILLTLNHDAVRRSFLAEIVDYVLAVEAITLTASDRADLLKRTYRSLFTLGPLDDVLADDTLTGITINGPFDVHVERGLQARTRLDTTFADAYQLEDFLKRLLAASGMAMPDDEPFIETGIMLKERRARLNIIAPPVSPFHTADIRIHPPQAPDLNDLETRFELLSGEAAALLQRILGQRHGLLIVGESGLGKTTLASALVRHMLTDAHVVTVERAAELALPPAAQRFTAHLSSPDQPPRDIAAALTAALDAGPNWLVLDELRGDESTLVWSALTRAAAPRYLWVMRADPRPERLRTALSMIIRKAQPGVEQAELERMITDHLPFVATLARRGGKPRLDTIAEWITDADGTLHWQPLIVFEQDTWHERARSQRLLPPGASPTTEGN